MLNNRIETRQQIQASWLEYLSFSSMKELRNNEMLFFKHYINYEWDNTIYLATIIWKSCHMWVEAFFNDPANLEIYNRDPEEETEENKGDLSKTDPKRFVLDKITKFAKDYAKEDYIAKYKKPEDFWNSKTMVEFGWYADVEKLVDEYKKKAEQIKDLEVVEDVKKWEDELEKIWVKIKKAIEKHKEKDQKLDDFINWWATGTIAKIIDGITFGMKNWFDQVFPVVKDWKLVGVEYNQTMDVADLNGEILEMPLKFIVDALFEDQYWNLIIVDWKFKGTLSDDTSIKPDYDMQGATYFFGVMSAMGKKPTKAIFIEIQPSDAKPPYMQQAELRDLCGKNEIDWEKWNNWKYMTNALMTDALMEKWVIELKSVVYHYEIDFTSQAYLLDMWLIFYKQTIKRLFQLLVQDDDFVPNIFDQAFDGGVTVYQEWMSQFKPQTEPSYTDDDAVDL